MIIRTASLSRDDDQRRCFGLYSEFDNGSLEFLWGILACNRRCCWCAGTYSAVAEFDVEFVSTATRMVSHGAKNIEVIDEREKTGTYKSDSVTSQIASQVSKPSAKNLSQ
jgi:hypothetical protein